MVKKIAIVGSPNVGKSVIFNCFTGSYVTVSNYPGTTVEVSRGKGKIDGQGYEIIDTPGMYSLMPITEEERVARSILLNENPEVVLHIIDAKNLERMLPLTLQLIEADLPVVLVLNIMDEAERMGIKFDIGYLERELKIPVVPTVSISGRGMDLLKQIIKKGLTKNRINFIYDDLLETNIKGIENLLKGEYLISKRAISLLVLQEDMDIFQMVKEKEGETLEIEKIVRNTKENYAHSLNYNVCLQRQRIATQIYMKAIKEQGKLSTGVLEKLSRITMNRWTGIPILLAVLYFGLYKFVGEFGAGTIVGFLETNIFKNNINPFVTKIVTDLIPWKVIQELFVGEYGIITLGIRYAVAIILPIVSTFFLIFAIIEDTGYLPRLSMLIDRVFKKIGLTGRAVIPMVLGLGCDTMATMVTRTLPTKRERVMATLLLALAVPCSAQLGVILALLENNPKALLVWLSVISMVFLFTGFLAKRILPGEQPIFFMEVPPLRFPKLSNVLIKTYTRMTWYFKEIFPLFILASIFIWFGQLTGIFDLMVKLLSYPVKLIDLPEKTAVAYLFGFFRRDYGAAGLYDMNKAGFFTGNQLVVAVVTMTLFLPCIAQFLINIKERGWKVGVNISVFIFFFAFIIGFLLNMLLKVSGVRL
jgi:ferrous iron transport protein B